jgi:hypothetical protein
MIVHYMMTCFGTTFETLTEIELVSFSRAVVPYEIDLQYRVVGPCWLYLCKRLKSSPKTRHHVMNDHMTIFDVDIQKLAFDSP